MPNSAEIIEKLATQNTCHKILLTIKEGGCKDLQELEKYILEMLEELER